MSIGLPGAVDRLNRPEVGIMDSMVEQAVDSARIRTLENEVNALKSSLEARDREIAALTQKARQAERMEKGLSLIQKWAEEKDDEFLIDLIDLIDG